MTLRSDNIPTSALIVAFVLLFTSPGESQILESATVADTGLQPSSLTLSPEMGALILTNFGQDSLQVFPLESNCALGLPKSSMTGKGPLALAVDAPRKLAYATYFTDDRLAIFSLAAGTPKEVGRYATGRGPVGVAITPGGNLIFVSNVFDGTVSVFERKGEVDLRLRDTVRAVSNPRSLAVDPLGRLLFVGDEREPVIAVLQIDSNGSVRSVSKYTTQGFIEDVLPHPVLPLLYVAEGENNRVSTLRISPQGRLSLATSESIEEFPSALGLDTMAQRRVTGRETNDIYVYDIRTDALKPLGSFPTYEYPEDLVVAPDSRCVYVLSSAYGKLHSLKVIK